MVLARYLSNRSTIDAGSLDTPNETARRRSAASNDYATFAPSDTCASVGLHASEWSNAVSNAFSRATVVAMEADGVNE
jgi:hypothetical protein